MNRKVFWAFVLGSLVAVAIWYMVAVVKYNKGKLVFCDVGQGNGVILTKGEFQLVYDTGPKNGKMLDCLAKNIPFWDKSLEVVIVSHWDIDHSGGLDEIDDYYVIGKLYVSQRNEQYIYSETLASDDILRSDWMEFKVLSVDSQAEDNYGSVVGLLTIDKLKVLLMGDVPMEVEQRLVWRKILTDKVDVILVGHHGSKTSSSNELLKLLTELNPNLQAVISVGKNSFGHPTKEVLDRLEKYGVVVRRTDKEGSIKYSIKI